MGVVRRIVGAVRTYLFRRRRLRRMRRMGPRRK
uniref:Uncharacterized protein n=1 Tax=Caudovirales sp. ct0jG3 TaxID=2825756 RepID=A0A8S5NT65_9CAUD|nr:MAG TPA: hypothetical protein [Caudovirales sp. ct0jG3]